MEIQHFDSAVQATYGHSLKSGAISTIQVNIGLKCNQACKHCHVESSPKRTEMMDWETMQMVIDTAKSCKAEVVDITGGAPELHEHFKKFVTTLRDIVPKIIVRTNLTVLLEEGKEDLPEFFQENKIELVASLPCYLEENVDKQRGMGVFNKSILALQRLNSLGYGVDPDLVLNLVYNPIGAVLAPAQEGLELAYKERLKEAFEISFSSLFTITNLPIGFFKKDLQRKKQYHNYMQLLQGAFNPTTLDNLMCRFQLNIGWDGSLYDCDFNYALGMKVNSGSPIHIRDFNQNVLEQRVIATGNHCYGCTAGAGSSCGGSLT